MVNILAFEASKEVAASVDVYKVFMVSSLALVTKVSDLSEMSSAVVISVSRQDMQWI